MAPKVGKFSEKGEGRRGKGELAMEKGKWKMENELTIDNGQLKIEN
jgi:hypothetical protein